MPVLAEEITDGAEDNIGDAPETCSCHGLGLPLLAAYAGDPQELLTVILMRAFMSGISAGDLGYWDRAMAIAEDALGSETGPLFHARVLVLVRAIRFERMVDFRFQSLDCDRVAEDEIDLLMLIQAMRQRDTELGTQLMARFARNPRTPRLAEALRQHLLLIARTAGSRAARDVTATTPLSETRH